MFKGVKFTWKAKDGNLYSKVIYDREEMLVFIEWLEFSSDVVLWW